MRSIGLILLITVAFIWAEGPPPPLPRMMHIYLKDGTTDSLACSRLSLTGGISFFDNGTKMKVELIDPSIQWYSTSMIDSITFSIIVPPVPPAETIPEVTPEVTSEFTPAPGPVLTMPPASGRSGDF